MILRLDVRLKNEFDYNLEKSPLIGALFSLGLILLVVHSTYLGRCFSMVKSLAKRKVLC